MGNLIDISGEKFNKLTAIKPSKRYKSGNVIWLCRCECGKECEVSGYLLRSGRQKKLWLQCVGENDKTEQKTRRIRNTAV